MAFEDLRWMKLKRVSDICRKRDEISGWCTALGEVLKYIDVNLEGKAVDGRWRPKWDTILKLSFEKGTMKNITYNKGSARQNNNDDNDDDCDNCKTKIAQQNKSTKQQPQQRHVLWQEFTFDTSAACFLSRSEHTKREQQQEMIQAGQIYMLTELLEQTISRYYHHHISTHPTNSL
jgi:hypothetical protein